MTVVECDIFTIDIPGEADRPIFATLEEAKEAQKKIGAGKIFGCIEREGKIAYVCDLDEKGNLRKT